MRKDKRVCNNPIMIGGTAFPCMKCGICHQQVSKKINKFLKKCGLNPKEVKFEYIF